MFGMSGAGPFTGILVCGGKSTRMGESKEALTFGHLTLFDLGVEKLRRVCDRVLVASPAAVPTGGPGFERVADDPAAKGPLAGLLAGLKAMKTAHALALGVDQPFIPVALLAHLCRRAEGYDVVMPVAERPQPLAAVYSRRAVYGFEAQIERAKYDLHSIFREKGLKRRRIEGRELAPFGDPARLFFNVNTAEDRETARLWWSRLDYDKLMGKEVQTMSEVEVGQVEHYFGKIGAAAVKITAGTLRVGDTIVIRGHSGELRQSVSSIQLEHESIPEAKPGQSVGIKVEGKVHEHDRVFKVTPD